VPLLPDNVCPDVNDMDPLEPAVADRPVPILMTPLLPDAAVPVPNTKAPLLPTLAVPVDKTTNPLTPDAPALAVCISKLPLLAIELYPVVSEICPPDDDSGTVEGDDVIPALRTKNPPSPLLPLPTVM